MYNLIKDYDKPFDGEGPFFTDYLYLAQKENPTLGLVSVDWLEDVYPYLAKHKTRLIERFNREYAYRELGQETEERWQSVLQARFDEVAEHFDHMYKVFEINDVDKLGTGYKLSDVLERNTSDSMDSSGNHTGDSKFKDTPSSDASVLNNPTNANHNTSTDTYTSTGKGNQNDKRDTVKEVHNDTLVKELNYLVKNYTSTDNEFIQSFQNMFIGIITVCD